MCSIISGTESSETIKYPNVAGLLRGTKLMAKKLKCGTLFPVSDEEWCPAGVHRDRGPCTFNQHLCLHDKQNGAKLATALTPQDLIQCVCWKQSCQIFRVSMSETIN